MKLYTLKNHGSEEKHARVLPLDNGTLILFSYEDPVAIAKQQKNYYGLKQVKIFYLNRGSNKISNTTYRHINIFINQIFIEWNNRNMNDGDVTCPVNRATLLEVINRQFKYRTVTKNSKEISLNYKRALEE